MTLGQRRQVCACIRNSDSKGKNPERKLQRQARRYRRDIYKIREPLLDLLPATLSNDNWKVVGLWRSQLSPTQWRACMRSRARTDLHRNNLKTSCFRIYLHRQHAPSEPHALTVLLLICSSRQNINRKEALRILDGMLKKHLVSLVRPHRQRVHLDTHTFVTHSNKYIPCHHST